MDAPEGNAGRGQPQHERIASRVQRQLRNFLGVDQAAAVRRLRFQQCGLTGDYYGLGHIA